MRPSSPSSWSEQLAAARSRTAGRYRGCARFDRSYVASKLRHDPVYADVLTLAEDGFGSAVDVGCGRGQFGILLLEAGVAESVIGLDWNAAHINQARQAAEGLSFRAEWRDLGHDAGLPDADTVFLIDVLYQLDPEAQETLLEAATRAAQSRVVIRTADTAQGLRSIVTHALEIFGRRVWPNAGTYVNPPPVSALVEDLAAAGFAVTEMPCWRGTPFSNRLIIGRR